MGKIPADARCGLDVSCGEGETTRRLRRRLASVIGVDLELGFDRRLFPRCAGPYGQRPHEQMDGRAVERPARTTRHLIVACRRAMPCPFRSAQRTIPEAVAESRSVPARSRPASKSRVTRTRNVASLPYQHRPGMAARKGKNGAWLLGDPFRTQQGGHQLCDEAMTSTDATEPRHDVPTGPTSCQ